MQKRQAESLIEEALEAEKSSYSPYSGFQVGAALMCRNGMVYRGCNIENSSYSATNCAERSAIFKAVSEGQREFTAIAVTGKYRTAGEEERQACIPCGVCLQVMEEFCDPDTFEVILGAGREKYKVYRLKELLPMGFRL